MKVSVVLTCFNHLKYLPDALDSVRQQTHKDLEVIAIDDCSTDGTREWLSQQPDITVILNPTNIGTYATLNVGLQAATGDGIAILNDDDIWLPSKLERQVQLLNSHPEVGLVHTNGLFIDGEGHEVPGAPLGFLYPKFTTGKNLLPLIYANKIIASAALVRRQCFERLGTFNGAYFGSGDWEMWLRIAEQYELGFVDEVLTKYRVHIGNASKKHEKIWQDDERLRLWIEARNWGDGSPEWNLALAHNAACLGTIKKLNGKASEARKMYALSIRRMPTRMKSYARWLTTFLPNPLFRRLT